MFFLSEEYHILAVLFGSDLFKYAIAKYEQIITVTLRCRSVTSGFPPHTSFSLCEAGIIINNITIAENLVKIKLLLFEIIVFVHLLDNVC